ncbi:MAG: FGGY-family carbohydrate kinase [Candidatus Thorarchaeota archaeon]|jgi:xylulokinase
MSQRIFAVFDIGTTGTRSVLVDEEGRELGKAYEEYPPIPRELATHEQLTETFWRAACTTMQRAISEYEPGPISVEGVVVATTRDCITPVDKAGDPLGPTILWTDNRISKKRDELAELIGPRRALRKILWMSENKAKLFNSAQKFITLDTFLSNRLCGAMVTEPSNARYGPINHSTLNWSDEICQETGIPVDMYAEIVNPGTLIGEITRESAKATGLRKGTPVIMGSGDQQCSALGTGTTGTGIIKATTGTGTFVISHTDDYVEDPQVMYSNPGAIPGTWILEGVLPGSGWAFKWYRDQFYHADAVLAGRSEGNVYELIESAVKDVPPGSDGLVFFPFMAFTKGIMYNLGFEHTKAHVARAIMEGNGYGIQFYTQTMEVMLDQNFSELRIDGGGANSPLWRQIISDCTNKTVVLPRARDSTVIGAAMIAAVGSGVYGSFDEAIDNMYHIEERRQPIPENVPVYEERYKVFNNLLLAELSTLLAHY